MSISLRSASLVLAALSASSVAPAQAGAAGEPILASNASLPNVITPESVNNAPADTSDSITIDPGASATNPLSDGDVATPDTAPVAETPAVRPSGDLASLVAQLRGSDPGSKQLECLAVGIYFEAKSEPLMGQLAVGEVIANRSKSGRFAPTYCGVLFQRSQFSFVRGHSYPAIPRAGRQWQTAVAIAKIVDQELKSSSASNALFFHARRVSPGWRLKRVASIGNHVFYR